MAAEGKQNIEIAEQLGIERTIVGRWRRRFVTRGLSGLEKDASRGGRPADTALARKIVEHTTQCEPPSATHWSTTSLANVLGTSPSTVSRVWRANGLKPHLVRCIPRRQGIDRND
ncbi:MAG: helix-turn-helix domain-containing protein [Planctomycetes bacterium]|nr:helix-turn-helix domain-containing protein [Planctomycetota bacterium]